MLREKLAQQTKKQGLIQVRGEKAQQQMRDVREELPAEKEEWEFLGKELDEMEKLDRDKTKMQNEKESEEVLRDRKMREFQEKAAKRKMEKEEADKRKAELTKHKVQQHSNPMLTLLLTSLTVL